MTPQTLDTRRGNVALLVAVLAIPLLAMVAFAIDVGYILWVKAELQTAADSAALAGASQLLDRDELKASGNPANRASLARDEAVKFCRLHTGGGLVLDLNHNHENRADGDVMVGYIANPRDHSSEMTYGTTPYNAVQVKVHRDDVRNGKLNLFFGPLFGHDTQDLHATATAILEGDRAVSGFRVTGSGALTSKLLPFAIEEQTWNAIVSGSGQDQWSYNPVTNAYSHGSDGIKEGSLYPSVNIDSPGNFGTIDIGATGNSTDDIKRQIADGPNQADFDRMGGQLKLGSNGTLVLNGDTGVSAGFKADLLAIRGQPRIIPIYRDPVVSSGNNAQFTIVGFAGVVITEVHLTGALTKKYMTIQPEFVIDATAIVGETQTTPGRYVYRPLHLIR